MSINIFWCFLDSFSHGVSRSIPSCPATASISLLKYRLLPPDHGAIAPSVRVSSGLGTTNWGSTSYTVPKPSQCEHAPYGLLKEKFRGAKSSNDFPSLGRDKCWLKTISSFSAPSSRATISISATPSLRDSAVSIDSVKRLSIPFFITKRSTTTFIVCCSYRAKSVDSPNSWISPSISTRLNPCVAKSSSKAS